jgi:hypothetical protein
MRRPARRRASPRAVVRQALNLLEIGHSVIELRELIASAARAPRATALQQCVDHIGAWLRTRATRSCRRRWRPLCRRAPPCAPRKARRMRQPNAARACRRRWPTCIRSTLHYSTKWRLAPETMPREFALFGI